MRSTCRRARPARTIRMANSGLVTTAGISLGLFPRPPRRTREADFAPPRRFIVDRSIWSAMSPHCAAARWYAFLTPVSCVISACRLHSAALALCSRAFASMGQHPSGDHSSAVVYDQPGPPSLCSAATSAESCLRNAAHLPSMRGGTVTTSPRGMPLAMLPEPRPPARHRRPVRPRVGAAVSTVQVREAELV